MADGDEHAVTVDGGLLVRLQVAQPHAGHPGGGLAAEHLLDPRIPDHLDLRVGEQPVLQDPLGAQLGAPVDQRHLRGEVGQEQRLLDGGVAAADHHHLLAPVEEAVAGGAGRDPEALVLLLGLQAQPLGLGPRGDDHRLGQEALTRIAPDLERPARQVRLDHHVAEDLGADVLGLGAHLVHQPGPLDDVGEARIVLHLGGDGQLAARLDAGHHHRTEQGARRVDGRGIACGAGSDDQAADETGRGHERLTL